MIVKLTEFDSYVYKNIYIGFESPSQHYMFHNYLRLAQIKRNSIWVVYFKYTLSRFNWYY